MSHNEPRVSDAELESWAEFAEMRELDHPIDMLLRERFALDLRDCRAELTAAREALKMVGPVALSLLRQRAALYHSMEISAESHDAILADIAKVEAALGASHDNDSNDEGEK